MWECDRWNLSLKTLQPKQNNALEQQTTREPLVITDCLQTQREDTLKDKYVRRRMAVDSRCRVHKREKKKGKRNIRLCCAWSGTEKQKKLLSSSSESWFLLGQRPGWNLNIQHYGSGTEPPSLCISTGKPQSGGITVTTAQTDTANKPTVHSQPHTN